MRATDYKPAHGGYPDRRRVLVISRHHGQGGPGVVIVNSYGAPPAGFPRAAIEEAFALGLACGGGRR